jgi:hypothetical protein
MRSEIWLWLTMALTTAFLLLAPGCAAYREEWRWSGVCVPLCLQDLRVREPMRVGAAPRMSLALRAGNTCTCQFEDEFWSIPLPVEIRPWNITEARR